MRSTQLMLRLIVALCCIAGTPQARAAAPSPQATVVVGGAVTTPLHLDTTALRKLPRHSFEAADHGRRSVWEGVALADVLREAGAPLGDALRGRNLALYVRVSAADGYRAVYSLAELDPAMHDDDVILADVRDGRALDDKEGPFRIIARDDKRPARWVRQVTAIDLVEAPAP